MYGNSGRPSVAGRRTLLLGAVSLLALSGCISTALVEHWRDATYTGPPLHKVLVVGVQKDGGRRRIWEDGMVAALSREGLQATPSYRVYPDKAPSADELADGVLATHFVDASKSYYWSEFGPYPGYAPYGPFGFGWRHRYFGYWDWAYSPGYVDVQQRADYQTDVFVVDAAGGKLIWTGITRSVDLSSAAGVTDEISRVLVPELGREGILSGPSRH
jgi:hypothetical protein